MAPRQATQNIEVAGILIPKDTVIQLSPAVMNLHPSVWGPDSTCFNPDRWEHLTDEASRAYAFETFHNGPRVCIGKQLAMMEMKTILVELVKRFRIEMPLEARNESLEIASPTFTLRPKDKLVVRLMEL